MFYLPIEVQRQFDLYINKLWTKLIKRFQSQNLAIRLGLTRFNQSCKLDRYCQFIHCKPEVDDNLGQRVIVKVCWRLLEALIKGFNQKVLCGVWHLFHEFNWKDMFRSARARGYKIKRWIFCLVCSSFFKKLSS